VSVIRRRTVIAAAAAIYSGIEKQLVSYVFTDEFNGPAGSPPDPSKWNHETGRWTDNNELETYTDSTANAYLDGQGHLVIKASRRERIHDPQPGDRR
jgi:hypothetical protein